MNKTVWITGGSGGIGSAAADLFFENGWNVAIGCFRKEESAKEHADRLCRQAKERGMTNAALAISCDVSDRSSVFSAYKTLREQWGGVYGLVCCAGTAMAKLTDQYTESDWRGLCGVHLDGTFYSIQAVLPDMLRRHEGTIVTVSSIWGLTGGAMEVAYSAVKSGVIGLTKALAKEVGPSNITVNCVAPGVIDTEMNAALSESDRRMLREETPLCRIGTAKEAAESIYFLASDQARFITGQVLSPNGGFVI